MIPLVEVIKRMNRMKTTPINPPARRFALRLIFIAVFLFASQTAYPMTLEEERTIGKELYDKLQSHNLLVKDPGINRYITRVGEKVLAQTDYTLFDFTFSIVDSTAINAFATPGGYVYINKGLVNMIENESELAGVLAHEIAHITCRHIARRIEQSKKMSIATLAAILAGAVLGGGGAGTEAALGLSMAASATLQLKYSRQDEEEADRLGMASLTGAGYDGRGMIDLLKIMKNFEFYSNSIPSYFLTHPGTDERIRYIDALLQTRYKKRGKTNLIGGLSRIQTRLLLSEKDGDSALRIFENKLKKDASNVDALYGLAVIQGRRGRMDDSVRLFGRALALAPEDVDILRGIGINHFKSGKMAQAVEYLRKAYTIDSHDDRTLTYLARAYEEIGDLNTALVLFRDLQKLRPDDINLYYNLGMIYGKSGNKGESHFHFGMFNKKKDKSDTALFHFKEALKYYPEGTARRLDIQKEMEGLKPERKPPAPSQRKFEF